MSELRLRARPVRSCPLLVRTAPVDPRLQLGWVAQPV